MAFLSFEKSYKIPVIVIPAKAGIQGNADLRRVFIDKNKILMMAFIW